MMVPSSFVMVVEDDCIVAEQITQVLNKHGFTNTAIAANKKQALEVMKNQKPSLAIIDIKLKNSENGISIAKDMIRMAWLPVIFLTGNAMDEVLDNVIEASPVAFLEKPLRTNELIAQVKLALSQAFDEKSPFALGTSSGQLFVLTDRQYLRIKHEEILYIQGDRIYATVYLTKKEFNRLYPKAPAYRGTHVSSNLGSIYHMLPRQFYRLSKSYVINLEKVDWVGSDVLIIDGNEINIPGSAKKGLLERLCISKNL